MHWCLGIFALNKNIIRVSFLGLHLSTFIQYLIHFIAHNSQPVCSFETNQRCLPVILTREIRKKNILYLFTDCIYFMSKHVTWVVPRVNHKQRPLFIDTHSVTFEINAIHTQSLLPSSSFLFISIETVKVWSVIHIDN